MSFVAELARPAVGAMALAALAVSATVAWRPVSSAAATAESPTALALSPANDCVRAEPLWRAAIGPIAVVGTPSYEAVVQRIMPLEPAFAPCASTTARVVIYAHVTNREVTQLTVLGDDAAVARCVQGVIERLGLAVDDDVDLMIPVDLVK